MRSEAELIAFLSSKPDTSSVHGLLDSKPVVLSTSFTEENLTFMMLAATHGNEKLIEDIVTWSDSNKKSLRISRSSVKRRTVFGILREKQFDRAIRLLTSGKEYQGLKTSEKRLISKELKITD